MYCEHCGRDHNGELEPDPETLAVEAEERKLFYSSVGQGISLWSSMESCLIEIAARLLNTTPEKTGLIFYSISNFYTWLSIINELFLAAPEFVEHRKKFTRAGEGLRALNDTRVQLAHHSVFAPDPHGWTHTALRPGQYDSRSKSQRVEPLQTGEIIKFSQAVVAAENTLRELLITMEIAAGTAD
jgi:hypothetical protein